MRTTTFIAAAVGLLSACTDALQLQRRSDASARVIALDMVRKQVDNPLARDKLRKLRRRSKTVAATLDNEETLYFVNGTLGTPAQSLRLHIDTGSSDLWVNTATSTLCSEGRSPCKAAGTYSANSSSTYAYVASDFNISYVDGSGASGDYVTDTFTIGSTTLDKLQFGIGYTSSSPEGILGVGYEINEVQVGRAMKSAYKNLPAQMVSDGLINSNAFSLWLNDLDANTGSILFGGVDTARYHGQLETLPIQKESGYYAEFLITLTEVMLGNLVIAQDQSLAVLLDSGSSLTYLPDAIAEAIYEQVDAQYDYSEGAAYVPCSLASNSSALNFTFTSPTIQVTMDELVIPVTSSNGQQLRFTDGTAACLFGIAPAGESTAVLGDTFIRSAYIVYDLANNEISLAQTNFNATATNVVEITTGISAVPNAALVSNAATASSDSSGAVISGSVTLNSGSKSKNAAAFQTPPPLAYGMAALGAGLFYAM
ncbi:7749c42c-c53e-47a0-aeb0-0767cc4bb6ba [Sclerotinia trifoliorum]|uniref:Probable aspartic-type endopeptidase OPSB n=1 Tax=Sclerotinia trifoliorum TaxID=28548 RepID=A0A8H2ZKB5_9HELO|nr:7749c42c-c53e-47a0-aeb0-0767cc4bb6ba [Sclerotinia trifoliorum]